MDFRILGTLEVSLGDGPVRLGGPKQRALLAILLLHANEVVASDRLIDELWGEHAPASAQKALQVHVSQLRKVLEPAGEALATSAGGYVLRVGPGELDSARFESMVDEASHAGDPAAAVAALATALELWRGPALADFRYEPFAQAEAARLEDLRLDALERRIDARLALGQHAAVIGDVQSLVTREPLREHPRAQLMTALYRSGRQAEALEAYREARLALVEIGLTPGAELRELESAILSQDPSLELAAPAAAGTATNGRGDFVGRDEELGRAAGWIADAVAGHGRLVLVGGEPGIGKSRLLTQMAEQGDARGARVLWGRAWEAGGAPAYWPWLQALRSHVREAGGDAVRAQLGSGAPYVAQVLPEVAELLPPSTAPPSFDSDGARVRLFDALSTFLVNAAREQPLMLMLDDLHAADVPSLLLLQFLAGQLPDTRILVAGAYRDAAGGPGEALAATLVELSREAGVEQLSLRGLATSDVRRYIERTAGVDPPEVAVERIREDTAGNPLFVGELVRLLVAEGRLEDVADADAPRVAIPEEVRQVIARRLNRLSDECRRVLTLASVLGRDFGLDALGPPSELDGEQLVDVLDEALAARVVVRSPRTRRRLQFSHALVRDTLYDELGEGRRAHLHRAAGEALERVYAADPGPHLAELAHHFAEAAARGDGAKAVHYARRAGDRATGLLAFEEAVRLYRLALESLDVGETGDPATRCELLLAIGDAGTRAGDETAGKASFREAARIAREHDLPEQLARAALGYGGRFLWGRAAADPGLVPLLEDALEQLDERHAELRARVLGRLASALRDQPLRDRRVALAEEAVAIARELGDEATLCYALETRLEATEGADNVDEQMSLLPEMFALARASGDRERLIIWHENSLRAALMHGDAASALPHLEEMARLAEQLRQPAHDWLVAVWRTVIAIMRGEFATAEPLVERARELGHQAQSWNAEISHRVAMYIVRKQQGRLAEIEKLLERSADEYPALPRFQCMLASTYAELGRRVEASRSCDSLLANDLPRWHMDAEWLLAMTELAEAVAFLDDEQRAARLYPVMLPYARLTVVAPVEASTGSAARALGMLAAVLRRFDEAERHFEHALDTNERLGARPWVAHTKHQHARMLLRRGAAGDAERAHTLLDGARRDYEALGMAGWAERA